MKNIRIWTFVVAIGLGVGIAPMKPAAASSLAAAGLATAGAQMTSDTPLIEVQRGVQRGWRGPSRGAPRGYRPHYRPPKRYYYQPRYHGQRYRYYRPGYQLYGGWWYAFPWWLGAVGPRYYYPAQPQYGGRCEYWRQQCIRNWGYGGPNFRGCLRYHGCL
jgi:hypothetical protein